MVENISGAMDIIQILKEDYQRFPLNQTYSIYAPEVYFQDAVFKFRGVELYKKTLFLNFVVLNSTS